MDERRALAARGALSQETWLRIRRHLVVAGEEGLAAGAVAGLVEVSPSNVSFHLKELERAGLVSPRREGRSIVCGAAFDALSGLIRCLIEDCRSARSETCEPALAPSGCAPAAVAGPGEGLSHG